MPVHHRIVAYSQAREIFRVSKTNYWRLQMMKWLLVVFVMNTPVKTELSFPTLDECLRAEQEMRRQWAEAYNEAAGRKAGKDTLELVKRQMTSGTCIPTK